MADNHSFSKNGIPAHGRPPIHGMPEWFRQYLRTIEQIHIPLVALVALPAMLADAVPHPVDFSKMCKDFLNMEGKTYSRTEGYLEAKAWVSDCEKIFKELDEDDQLRRIITAWHLKGEALEWWNFFANEHP